MKYKIEFHGRLSGAIGVSYYCVAYREAASIDAAILALYDEYEHLIVKSISECDQ